MTSTFTIYEPNTGRLRWTVRCPDFIVEVNIPPGMSCVDGEWSPYSYFVFNGEPRERPAIEVVIDGHTISNLPIPCTVKIDGQRYEVDDGVMELDSNHPGPHTLSVEAFPYKPTKITLP